MEGLAMAAEAARGIVENADREHPVKAIYFFVDNTGALQRIHKGTPGKAQRCSQRFRSVVFPILRSHQDIKITLAWVPGHLEIVGNERSDKLAKEGSKKQPEYPQYHSAAFSGCIDTKETMDKSLGYGPLATTSIRLQDRKPDTLQLVCNETTTRTIQKDIFQSPPMPHRSRPSGELLCQLRAPEEERRCLCWNQSRRENTY
ncbi:hypothetical protein BS47DRAFT_1415133 [Hydnum rufescens UP504]|uniref:RNase H type-1 domain-containing protein n=1 Tax=Hydnum rufescens UP504 TaxID=1448309 RepID=A0A9P6DRU3_9AGAM|nr:hypothetical protein BS47DRAFT_1415133 [Hydnum rufescens UP504]